MFEKNPGAEAPLRIVAYRLPYGPEMALVPASHRRDWIDRTPGRDPARCLPLLMANQAGWWVLNSHDFTVRWNGDEHPSGITLACANGASTCPASSHFGRGIVTFRIPYLFRTPAGWNLLARGPANLPRDAIAPLEGLIETDWATATFTMSWQITRPHTVIQFRKEEPICMVVPHRRGELEAFQPTVAPLAQMPEADEYLAWRRRRDRFRKERRIPGSAAAQADWQRDYMLGRRVDGERVASHQRRLRLRAFSESE